MDKIGVGYFGEVEPGYVAGHCIMFTGNTFFDGQAQGKTFESLLRQQLHNPNLVVEDENLIFVFRIENDNVDEVEDKEDQRVAATMSAAQKRQIMNMTIRMQTVRDTAKKGQTQANAQPLSQPNP